MSGRRSMVRVACAVAWAAVTWLIIVLLSTAGETLTPPQAPSTDTEPAGDHGGGSPTSRAIRPKPGVPSRLRVIDTLTGTIVPGARLIDKSGTPVGTTNSAGEVDLADLDPGDITSAQLHLLTGPTIRPLHDLTRVEHGDAPIATCRVDFTSGLDLTAVAPPTMTCRLKCRVYGYPDLPPVGSLAPNDYEQLRFNRSAPGIYVELMKEHGLLSAAAMGDHEFVVDVSAGYGRKLVYVPIQGPVIVNIHEERLAATNKAARLTSGCCTAVTCEVTDPPYVSGRTVGPDGKPFEECVVTVTCHITIGPGDFVPYDGKRPSRPTFNMIGDKGSNTTQLYCSKRGRASTDGTWNVRVPFTGDVSCYAFVDGMERVLERRHVKNYESISGVELRTRHDDYDRVVTLVDASTGKALEQCDFRVHQCDPPDPLQMQYPPLRSDGRGNVRVGWLTPDVVFHAYRIVAGGIQYHPMKTRLDPGTVVSCARVREVANKR